jgi:hypothetical protein
VVKLSPFEVNFLLWEPLCIENAFVDINFILFAPFDNCKAVRLKIELFWVFTSPCKVFLVQTKFAFLIKSMIILFSREDL